MCGFNEVHCNKTLLNKVEDGETGSENERKKINEKQVAIS